MIRHNVLFEIKPTASTDDVEHAFALLFNLKKKIKGFLRAAGGECRVHGNKGSRKRLYGFSIDFNDEDAYNEFLANPITDEAKSSLLKVIDNDYAGIYGFDIGKTPSAPALNPLTKYRILTPRLVPPGA